MWTVEVVLAIHTQALAVRLGLSNEVAVPSVPSCRCHTGRWELAAEQVPVVHSFTAQARPCIHGTDIASKCL